VAIGWRIAVWPARSKAVPQNACQIFGQECPPAQDRA